MKEVVKFVSNNNKKECKEINITKEKANENTFFDDIVDVINIIMITFKKIWSK